MSSRDAARRPRIGLYGFFGMGNLGNEGSLDAVLAHLRAAHPEAEVMCFGADAAEITREHGIPGVQLMAFRAAPGDRRPRTQLRKVLGRLWDAPRTLALLGRVDLLVVPGTGVLESRLMSTPWGLPYWMALALTACRLRGRPSALVSVGAEPPTRRTTGVLFRHALRSATHVTFRDATSRRAALGMGVLGHPGTVAPDVAFHLPAPEGIAVRRGHVVLGVMTFPGAADDPQRGEERVDAYLARMAELAVRLLDEERTVTVVVGDRSDLVLAQRLEETVRRLRPSVGDALSTSRADTMAGVMREMAAAEVVVASRFHNVIAALKARRPVLSLGYAGKNAELLDAFGLEGCDQPIDDVDVTSLLGEVARLSSAHEDVSRRLDPLVRDAERAVAASLTAVSAALVPPVSARWPEGRRWAQ